MEDYRMQMQNDSGNEFRTSLMVRFTKIENTNVGNTVVSDMYGRAIVLVKKLAYN